MLETTKRQRCTYETHDILTHLHIICAVLLYTVKEIITEPISCSYTEGITGDQRVSYAGNSCTHDR